MHNLCGYLVHNQTLSTCLTTLVMRWTLVPGTFGESSNINRSFFWMLIFYMKSEASIVNFKNNWVDTYERDPGIAWSVHYETEILMLIIEFCFIQSLFSKVARGYMRAHASYNQINCSQPARREVMTGQFINCLAMITSRMKLLDLICVALVVKVWVPGADLSFTLITA